MTTGNLLYAQSGGVTAVINATAAGVIAEARARKIKVLAARNGILGALREELIDTSKESAAAIAALAQTPGGAFGSCRYKLKSLEEDSAKYERLLDVLRAHDVRWFLYNGGNDSADTAWKVSQLAKAYGYPLHCIGVPKTIDNDLAATDTCPGFGSAAKYTVVSVREAALDVAAMGAGDRQRVAARQHLLGQPLRAGGVPAAGIQHRLHRRIAARQGITDNHLGRVQRNIGRRVSLCQRNAQRFQLCGHRRIDGLVAAFHLPAQLTRQGGHTAHESSGDAENVEFAHAAYCRRSPQLPDIPIQRKPRCRGFPTVLSGISRCANPVTSLTMLNASRSIPLVLLPKRPNPQGAHAVGALSKPTTGVILPRASCTSGVFLLGNVVRAITARKQRDQRPRMAETVPCAGRPLPTQRPSALLMRSSTSSSEPTPSTRANLPRCS